MDHTDIGDSAKVLLLTFTKNAADEMKQRAQELVGACAGDVLACTFHSFCARVLRRHGKALNLPSDFVVLDDGESKQLIKSARKKLGFENKDRQKIPIASELRKMFSYAVSVCQPLREVLLEKFWKYHEAEHYLDFDDLLEQCDLSTPVDRTRNWCRQNCEHVLVDEYQDTDLIQASILKRITSCKASPRITVVGDDAQGIYGFRGADITNIQDFEDIFPDVSVFKLEENYRSHQKILDLANSVMSLAKEGYRKTLQSQLPGGPAPELAFFKNRSAEAQWVLSQLELLHKEKGFQWRDMAVLFRKKDASKLLEAELRARDVPYHLVGRLKWTESAHVKDLMAVLQCAFVPRHRLAWKRAAGRVGEIFSDRIFEDIFMNSRLVPEKWHSSSFGQDLSTLAELLEELNEMDHDPKRCVALAREWYQPYFEKQFADYEERMEDFLVFEDFVENWDMMTDVLEEMNLSAPSDEGEDVVTFSTIHAAKGLEWDCVFIIDLVDGYPQYNPPEEELRILYVGITRARRELFLTCPGQPLSPWLDRTPNLSKLVQVRSDVQHSQSFEFDTAVSADSFGALAWGCQQTLASLAVRPVLLPQSVPLNPPGSLKVPAVAAPWGSPVQPIFRVGGASSSQLVTVLATPRASSPTREVHPNPALHPSAGGRPATPMRTFHGTVPVVRAPNSPVAPVVRF
eukprot:s296_g44.t1